MSDKTDIWMPLYIGDYLAATTHLSAIESGAYLHLLMHQWKNGKLPESSEALRRIARVEPDAWSNAWAMLQTFFDHAQGFPVQIRLETIRDEWQQKKAKNAGKAKVAAAARWQKDAPSNAPSNAKPMHKPCPSSSPSPSQEEQKQKQAQAPFVFPDWLDATAWKGFEEMRKRKRSELTDHARELCIRKLETLKRAGHDPTQVLNQSTMYGWQGLFELKGESSGANQQHRGANRVEQAIAELAKAGVTFTGGGLEGCADEVRAAPGGSHGRDAPGVVLEGVV